MLAPGRHPLHRRAARRPARTERPVARASAVLLAVVLAAAAGCGGGSGGGGGGGAGGGGGGGGGVPPGAATVIESSLGVCSPSVADRWSFDVARGRTVSLQVDTIDPATAADLCIVSRCGNVDLGGDDEMPCDPPAPSFACPRTEVLTRGAGPCVFDVRPCSDACTSAALVDYRITAADDTDRDALPLLCMNGPNDAEDCRGDDDCENGACLPMRAVPVRGRAEPLPADDVPTGADTECTLTVNMDSVSTYTTLKYKIDYGAAQGGFPGEALDVECRSLAGSFSFFNDFDAARVLATTLTSGTGITGPRDLVRCAFRTAARELEPDVFVVAVGEAIDATDGDIDPQLVVRVTCGASTTTSLPASSSTTLAGSSTTLPGSSTTLPRSSTTLPGSGTTLPGASTTLPGSSTTLPGATTTLPPVTTTLPAGTCGELVTRWGSIGSAPGRLSSPTAVAVDAARDVVYVVDAGNRRIQKFDLDGGFVLAWSAQGGGRFSSPRGIAVDGTGNVYVADTNNDRVQKYDSGGTLLADWGSSGTDDGEFDQPVGVVVGADDSVYVGDRGNARIQRFDASGAFLLAWGEPGNGSGQLRAPEGLAVTPAGNIVVADSQRDRLVVFDADGGFITEFGSSGSGAGRFSAPIGVSVRPNGTVFVADAGNDRIQQLGPGGGFRAQFGSFGRGDGQFDAPQGVAVSGAASVFVADTGNHRIQKFTCR